MSKILSNLNEKKKLDLIKYNNQIKKRLKIDIQNYKKSSGKYKIDGINGNGKEYIIKNNLLIFEGEYKSGKRNGKGKEYKEGFLVFEGEYKNGKRINGNIKEFFKGKKYMKENIKKE